MFRIPTKNIDPNLSLDMLIKYVMLIKKHVLNFVLNFAFRLKSIVKNCWKFWIYADE